MAVVSAAEIRVTAERALERVGVPRDHAALQADLLIEAELRGRVSHGLLRLPRVIERINNGLADPLTTGLTSWQGTGFLEVDGQDGLGPVVACAALDLLCDRVSSTGVAVAAIKRSNHLGMIAWYAERIAAKGQTIIVLTTSEALVYPWGGRRAMIGTNPIAIGIPAAPRPFVIDMATSLVSMGQIHDHADRGIPIPDDWALDVDGNRTTDPVAAKEGAIAPFGDAKGYALGLAFELLVATLTESALGRDVRGTLDSTFACNKGDLFIVIDAPATARMTERIGVFLAALRACPAAEGFAAVAVPGDRSTAQRERRLAEGLPLNEALWARLRALAGHVTEHQPA